MRPLLLDAGGAPLTAPTMTLDGQTIFRDAYSASCPIPDEQMAQWRVRLRKISPHNDQLSYLHLCWEPGWPWEPVGRLMLFEMIPSLFVDGVILADCNGPNPERINERDTITGELTQKTMITAMQWKLYQETGRYGRPFWVIQGGGGGHKVFFSPVEKRMLKHAGYPDSLPAPGELPYAPFDNRVMDQIVRHDKLLKADGNVRRMADMSASGAIGMQRAFRKQLVAWLGSQVDEAAKAMVADAQANDMPQDTTQLTPETVMDEQIAQYIEGGKFTDISR